MGKSKHPGLLEKAAKDVARMNSSHKRDVAALKGVITAAASLGKSAGTTSKGFSDQYKYLAKLIDQYARKVAEIIEAERQQSEAKGDKKKEAELKKKLAKLEKEADAIRKEYNLAGEVFGALTALFYGEVDALGQAIEKFEGFEP